MRYNLLVVYWWFLGSLATILVVGEVGHYLHTRGHLPIQWRRMARVIRRFCDPPHWDNEEDT